MFYLFLILIFIRPFFSSLISPYPNLVHSALLFSLLAAWIIAEKFSLKKLQVLRGPFILFCISLVISTVFSQNKLNSLAESYKYLVPFLMLWAMANLDQSKKQMIVKCLVWAGFIISLIALRQYFVGFDDTMKYLAQEKINDPYAVLILQRNRVFSPFVTPDVLAGYLIMILPLFILLRDRIFMAVPILLALMLTGSLGAMMSLLLAAGIYFYANGKFSRKAIFGLAGFLLIVVVIYIYRHVHPDSQMRPGFSLGMRLNYWRDALAIIKDHLITGVGLGNFNLDNSRYAHNSYLQIWAETGILGIVAFIWLLKTFLRSNKGITVLSIACVVFLIHNLIDFTFFLPEIVFIWWTLLGLNLGENEVPAKGSPLAPPLERR